MFAKRYAASVNSSNLMDDQFHHSTEALIAAALADKTGAGIGALLSRVKYTDGKPQETFDYSPSNLAQLLRAWISIVTEKGKSRRWMPPHNTEWDIQAAHTLYRRVAEASLAHWLDGACKPCNGVGRTHTFCTCPACKGSGRAPIVAGRFESEKIADMVSELEALMQAHNARASARMRRAA